jgi:hypothetical protein
MTTIVVSVDDVAAWLKKTFPQLRQASNAAKKEGIDGEVLRSMDEGEIERYLGVQSFGHRRQLVWAIKALPGLSKAPSRKQGASRKAKVANEDEGEGDGDGDEKEGAAQERRARGSIRQALRQSLMEIPDKAVAPSDQSDLRARRPSRPRAAAKSSPSLALRKPAKERHPKDKRPAKNNVPKPKPASTKQSAANPKVKTAVTKSEAKPGPKPKAKPGPKPKEKKAGPAKEKKAAPAKGNAAKLKDDKTSKKRPRHQTVGDPVPKAKIRKTHPKKKPVAAKPSSPEDKDQQMHRTVKLEPGHIITVNWDGWWDAEILGPMKPKKESKKPTSENAKTFEGWYDVLFIEEGKRHSIKLCGASSLKWRWPTSPKELKGTGS